MAKSTILAVDQIAENQASSYLTANGFVTALEKATQSTLEVDLTSGDTTLSQEQFLENVHFHCVSASAETTLTIPSELTIDTAAQTPKRMFAVTNGSASHALNVTDATATVQVNPETTSLLIYDGTNLVTVAGGGVSTDAPSDGSTYGRKDGDWEAFMTPGDPGDGVLLVEKGATANKAVAWFRENFNIHAEIGLVGDNDLLFKVSPDGVTFYEGIRIDKDTGEVSFPNGSSDIRDILTSNTTLYVDAATGSDSNDGLTTGTAYLTLQAALDRVCDLDIGINTVTIQLANGSYAGATPRGPFTGSGVVRVCGDPTTPSNVIVGSGTGYGLNVDKPMRLLVEGCEFRGSVSGLRASTGGVIVINDTIALGTCGVAQIEADGAGATVLSAGKNIEFNGGAAFGFRAIFGGYIRATGATYTFNGAWNYSNKFAQAISNGTIYATASTFAGSYASVTGKRYAADALGVIQTSGAGVNYFPGDVAGTTATGGQYV